MALRICAARPEVVGVVKRIVRLASFDLLLAREAISLVRGLIDYNRGTREVAS